MNHARAIIEAIGPDDIAAELGLTEFSIRAAKRDDLFPARWYGPLKGLCEKRGVECPISAFRWVDADKKVVGGQSAFSDYSDNPLEGE
jgi:hypothetical protein